MEKAASRYSGK